MFRKQIGRWAILVLVLLMTSIASRSTKAQSSATPPVSAKAGPSQYLPAAVSVDVKDAGGATIRTVNGTLIQAGVIVPVSSLKGGTKAVVRSRSGDSWTTESVVASHSVTGIAILGLPETPDYAFKFPAGGGFMPESKVTILGGPGSTPDSVSSVIHYTFAMRDGTDFVSVSPGLSGACPVLDRAGRFLGVAGDLSTQGYKVGFMIPMVSVRAVAGVHGDSHPISGMATASPPAFENAETAAGLTFRAASLATAGSQAKNPIDTEAARALLAKAIKLDPSSVDAHFWMGRVLFVLEQWDQTAEEFQEAAKLDPNYHLAWHLAGAAYNQGARYLDAEKMYMKALEVKPNAADTYCNLGGAYFNEHRNEKAIEAFKKSIELDPRYQYGLAYSNLALTFSSMGQKDEAEKVYQDLLKVFPESAAHLREALDGQP
jgi:Tfp pilus assembly protein PilF